MATIITHPKKSILLLFLTNLLVSNFSIASSFQPRQSPSGTEIRNTLLQERNGNDGSQMQVRSRISKAPTCPDPAVISPCKCAHVGDNDNEISMFCETISSDAELADIFQQEFPHSDFHTLNIEDSALEALTPGIFGNKTFQDISIWTSGLQRVESGALASSYSTLEIIRFDGNNLSQFPFEDLPLFTKLSFLDLSFNSLSGFPSTLVSSSLKYLYLDSNNLSPIPADGFQQLPMLERISLANNGITDVLPGTFTGFPSLYSVGLDNNSLTELLSGTIELHGPFAQVFFRDNDIRSVEVNAFTAAATQVRASSNALEELEEQVWRPSLENSAWLFVENNPLKCGCDIAWIIRNPAFLVLVSGTCADGTDIQELDPADFTDC